MRSVQEHYEYRYQQNQEFVDNENKKQIRQKTKTIDNISINIEKGIFNYAIKDASSKIVKKWDNVFFAQIYTDQYELLFQI